MSYSYSSYPELLNSKTRNVIAGNCIYIIFDAHVSRNKSSEKGGKKA